MRSTESMKMVDFPRQALGWVVVRETIPTLALRATPPREGIFRRAHAENQRA